MKLGLYPPPSATSLDMDISGMLKNIDFNVRSVISTLWTGNYDVFPNDYPTPHTDSAAVSMSF